MEHGPVKTGAGAAGGSPRLEARRRSFLEAARGVFLEKGYAAATLDDVIARSGGSRQTLYSLFRGKQGLFEAIVGDSCAEIFRPLRLDGVRDRQPEDVLADLGRRYLETVTGPETIAVYRLVVSEGAHMSELAQQFWKSGPGRLRALLGAYLVDQAGRGALRIEHPDDAAQQFLGMLLGQHHMQCVLGLRERPGGEEIARFVRSAVARFLDGCRPDPNAPLEEERMPEIADNPARGRFEMPVGGETAFVTYRWDGPTLVLVHTEVPQALAGQGIGSKLAHGVLEQARARELRIVAECEFLAGYIARHPEFAAMVAD